jgi:hypothetical protein
MNEIAIKSKCIEKRFRVFNERNKSLVKKLDHIFILNKNSILWPWFDAKYIGYDRNLILEKYRLGYELLYFE